MSHGLFLHILSAIMCKTTLSIERSHRLTRREVRGAQVYHEASDLLSRRRNHDQLIPYGNMFLSVDGSTYLEGHRQSPVDLLLNRRMMVDSKGNPFPEPIELTAIGNEQPVTLGSNGTDGVAETTTLGVGTAGATVLPDTTVAGTDSMFSTTPALTVTGFATETAITTASPTDVGKDIDNGRVVTDNSGGVTIHDCINCKVHANGNGGVTIKGRTATDSGAATPTGSDIPTTTGAYFGTPAATDAGTTSGVYFATPGPDIGSTTLTDTYTGSFTYFPGTTAAPSVGSVSTSVTDTVTATFTEGADVSGSTVAPSVGIVSTSVTDTVTATFSEGADVSGSTAAQTTTSTDTVTATFTGSVGDQVATAAPVDIANTSAPTISNSTVTEPIDGSQVDGNAAAASNQPPATWQAGAGMATSPAVGWWR